MSNTNDTTKQTTEEDTFTPVENPIKELEFVGIQIYDMIEDHRIENLTFEEWNEKQISKNRIYHPTAFTMEAPIATFDKIETGSAINEKNEVVSFTFTKMKEDKGHGRLQSIVVTSPACISQRGFRENEAKGQKIKSTGAILDMSNPHHRHFWEITCMGIVNQFIDFMMTNPGQWDFKFKKIDSDFDRNSTKYKDAYKTALESLSTIIRFPKIGEEFDTESNIRMIYINPMNYIDKKDPKKNSHMKTFLPHQTEPITQDDLELICQGWEIDPNTKEPVLGKPKGFEFSFRWLFSRGVRTSKNSIQPKGTAMYIHRIFDAPEFESKDSRHMKSLEETIDADFSRFVGVSGFKKTEESIKATAVPVFIPTSTIAVPAEERTTLPPPVVQVTVDTTDDDIDIELPSAEPVASSGLRTTSGSSLPQGSNFGGSSIESQSQSTTRPAGMSFAKFGGKALKPVGSV